MRVGWSREGKRCRERGRDLSRARVCARTVGNRVAVLAATALWVQRRGRRIHRGCRSSFRSEWSESVTAALHSNAMTRPASLRVQQVTGTEARTN